MSASSGEAPVQATDDDGGAEFPFTPRGIHRAAVRSGSIPYTAPSLVFMLFVLIPVLYEDSLFVSISICVLSVVYSFLFAYSGGIRTYGERERAIWLGLAWLVVALMALLMGSGVLYMVMFVLMQHVVVLPWRIGRVVVFPIAFVSIVLSVLAGEYIAVALALVGLGVGFGVGSGIDREILRDQLESTQRRNAVLAVAAERERIGRDLHDILGHTLTTITVSAQLSQKLLESEPAAAREQVAEIERLSRQSLADVRSTVSGMQQVRAATEIASARSVLLAAGIETDVPSALPEMTDERSELFGYVVREAITNVVRHARATHCAIEVERDAIQIADDGIGMSESAPCTGLAGLASRVEEAGGELSVGPGPDGDGTVVRAQMARSDAGAPADPDQA